MWAGVAVIPLTVTFAVTEQSAATLTVALPVALEPVGGTSLLPDSVSRSPPLEVIPPPDIMPWCIPSQPTTSAATVTVAKVVPRKFFIVFSFGGETQEKYKHV